MAGNRRKTWLEVALNGGWGQSLQPLLPIAVDNIIAEGIACVRAGAAIVHFHAYDAVGQPSDDPGIYAAVIEGIRSEVDAIVYPTIAFGGDDRHAFVADLARKGLLEWAVLDPGSVNISRFVDIAAGETGSIYSNDEAGMRQGLRLAREFGFRPSYACYEPGFIRLGAALHAAFADVPRPIYRLMFSDGLTFGFPPRRYALEAYRALLAEEAPDAAVMIAGLDVDLTDLINDAVEAGFHLRVGLEDAPLGSRRGNLELVEQAVAKLGEAPALAADIRDALSNG
jgi:3-keto-5-aminohexanoate cleavage enzyme